LLYCHDVSTDSVPHSTFFILRFTHDSQELEQQFAQISSQFVTAQDSFNKAFEEAVKVAPRDQWRKNRESDGLPNSITAVDAEILRSTQLVEAMSENDEVDRKNTTKQDCDTTRQQNVTVKKKEKKQSNLSMLWKATSKWDLV
jgi:hypothetical protein